MSDIESQSNYSLEFEEEYNSEDDMNVKLIRSVKERPSLYTKTDKRYSDRNLTERTWAQIASELGITRDEAKEKWTRLRNNFGKVLARRKAKSKKPSGSAASGSHYNKPWIYEADMDFLKRHITLSSRIMSSSINRAMSTPSPTPMTSLTNYSYMTDQKPHMEEMLAVDDCGDNLQPSPRSSETAETSCTTPKRSTKSISKSLGALDQAMISYVNTMASKNEEPLLLWFKSLIPTLKTLPPEQLFSFQIHTMQEIQRITSPYHQERQPYDD